MVISHRSVEGTAELLKASCIIERPRLPKDCSSSKLLSCQAVDVFLYRYLTVGLSGDLALRGGLANMFEIYWGIGGFKCISNF